MRRATAGKILSVYICLNPSESIFSERKNGGERIRTADLCVANAPLSHLSYTPIKGETPFYPQRILQRSKFLTDTFLSHLERYVAFTKIFCLKPTEIQIQTKGLDEPDIFILISIKQPIFVHVEVDTKSSDL